MYSFGNTFCKGNGCVDEVKQVAYHCEPRPHTTSTTTTSTSTVTDYYDYGSGNGINAIDEFSRNDLICFGDWLKTENCPRRSCPWYDKYYNSFYYDSSSDYGSTSTTSQPETTTTKGTKSVFNCKRNIENDYCPNGLQGFNQIEFCKNDEPLFRTEPVNNQYLYHHYHQNFKPPTSRRFSRFNPNEFKVRQYLKHHNDAFDQFS